MRIKSKQLSKVLKLIDNQILKLVTYLSRRDIDITKIKHYNKIFLYSFSVLFLLTAFSYNFNIEGAIFGVKVSLNGIVCLIETIIFGIVTFLTYSYYRNYSSYINIYKKKLLDAHNEITCAYGDKLFGNKVYKIDIDNKFYSDYHIVVANGAKYKLNDHRIFKFVSVKNSRKLKLKNLQDSLKEA